jgi:hypothetical protein
VGSFGGSNQFSRSFYTGSSAFDNGVTPDSGSSGILSSEETRAQKQRLHDFETQVLNRPIPLTQPDNNANNLMNPLLGAASPANPASPAFTDADRLRSELNPNLAGVSQAANFRPASLNDPTARALGLTDPADVKPAAQPAAYNSAAPLSQPYPKRKF